MVEALRYEPVAGSILDGVIGNFYCSNSVDLASNRKEYQGYLLGAKTTFRRNSEILNFLESLGACSGL
jgi:hypothetical protein